MLQETAKHILWYGECSCLWHWNHLYAWERITQTIGIPSRIRKISEWNKCSTYLRNWCPNKMRSMEWKQLIGKTLHGSICLLIGDRQVISLQRTKVYVFSDSVLCLGKIHENRQSNTDKLHQNTGLWTEFDGEPMEFEWNIFPRFNTLQLSQEVQELQLRQKKHQSILQEGSSSC